MDKSKCEIFFERQIFENSKTLEDTSYTEERSFFDRQMCHMFFGKYDRAMLWLLKTIDQIDQWCLATSVRANKPYRLPFFDMQINTIDDVIVSYMSLEIAYS